MTHDDHMRDEKRTLQTGRRLMYKLEFINMTKGEAFWHMDVKNAGLCKSALPCCLVVKTDVFLKMFPFTNPLIQVQTAVLLSLDCFLVKSTSCFVSGGVL